MVKFIIDLRLKMGPSKKVCLFGDNARINSCNKVKAAAIQIEGLAECRLIWN